MKKNLSLFLFLFIIFTSLMGFASYLIAPESINTQTSLVHSDEKTDYVNVNVHYETIDTGGATSVEYFIPDKFTIEYNISPFDASGDVNYEAYSAPVYDGKTGSLNSDNQGDRIPIYYDVVDGKYTAIQRHNISIGPEQIKSFSFNVETRKKVNNESQYGIVWKTNVKNANGVDDYLRFACDSGNTITGHGDKYGEGDVYKSDQIISQETVKENNKIVTSTIYQRITVYKIDAITYGSVDVACVPVDYNVWVYYPQYEVRMTRITTTTNEPVFFENVDTIKVKRGSLVNPIILNVPNYTNYGYFDDPSYNNYFNFNRPIDENSDIYLRYIQSSKEIANKINNLSNGSSLNFHDTYKGGSGNGYNIGEDDTYHISTNSVFIDKATISQGATVNLTFGNDEIYIEPNIGSFSENLGNHRTNSDNAIAPDYNGTNSSTYNDIGYSNASVYMILNDDLTINGTLNIGGEIGGSSTSNNLYSYIIGRYALLDLYGHDIIINNGGVLKNYGLIKDSVGGGKIIINNGGELETVVTISDGRGRDQSAVGLSKRQSLFTEYKLSYLQVPCIFYHGSTLNGYLKIDFNTFGIVNTNIQFLGNNKNMALFAWSSNNLSTDYVLYKPYQIEAIATPGKTEIYTKMYNYRNLFSFHANLDEAGSYILNANLSTPMGNLSADFDFARIDFPISPFFDIVVNRGYSLSISSKMTFYPGSSFYGDYGSNINFNIEGYKVFDPISMGLTIAGESRYIAGGIMAYSNRISDVASKNYSRNRFSTGVYGQTAYRDYVKPSNINIYSNINFNNQISTEYDDSYYYLSGPINFSKEAINKIKENRNFIKTYDVKSELTNGFFYNNTYQDLDNQIEYATSFNLNPLICNNISYLIDKNNLIEGNYDWRTGILTTKNNDMYYLWMDNDLYTDGSGSSNQGSKIDRNILIKKVIEKNEANIIKDEENKYFVYYCGINVPLLDDFDFDVNIGNNFKLNVNLRKFMSNSNSEAASINFTKYTLNNNGQYDRTTQSVNISSLYANAQINYNSASKDWSFYQFNQYSKTGNDVYWSY